MTKAKFLLLVFLTPFFSCANSKEQKAEQKREEKIEFPDSVIAAQTIMVSGGKLGRSNREIASLISGGMIGGVIFLKANRVEILEAEKYFDSIAASKGLPQLIYATDAEPGMFSKKIEGVSPTPYNRFIEDEKSSGAAAISISEDLFSMGMRWNFAPVCDLSGGNEAIGDRSYQGSADEVASLAWAFTRESQREGIAATAKHFPGHGTISGDTHEGLAYIQGEFRELAPFKALIDSGVASVMIGHIAVFDNPYSTDSLPSSCSKRIIQDLLVDSLGFEGLIVTDAMNMGAIRQVNDPEIASLEAGVHMILMPRNPQLTYEKVVSKMKVDENFRMKVIKAGKKVLNLKEQYPR